MTHKIYWAERGLRYLYEVVTAELFMYTFCMIFMRMPFGSQEYFCCPI